MFNNASSQVIIVYHTFRRSIECRIYVLTHLLIVVSLFCPSMFCRTSDKIFESFPILKERPQKEQTEVQS